MVARATSSDVRYPLIPVTLTREVLIHERPELAVLSRPFSETDRTAAETRASTPVQRILFSAPASPIISVPFLRRREQIR